MRNKFVYDEIARLKIKCPDIETEAQEYFSQCGEDIILLSLVRGLCWREGLDVSLERYLEIGANHPVATSATYLLHRTLGMCGVLVEPNPRLIPDLRVARPYDIILPFAVSENGREKALLYVSNKSELSSLSKAFVENWENGAVGLRDVVEVEAWGINDILSEYFPEKAPLYISIDIEGKDLDILKGLDFSKWRPCFIQIEPSDFFIKNNTKDISKFLINKNYILLCKTDVNLIFCDMNRLNGLGMKKKYLNKIFMNIKASLRHPFSSSRRRAYRSTNKNFPSNAVPSVEFRRAKIASRVCSALRYPMNKNKRRAFRSGVLGEQLDAATFETLVRLSRIRISLGLLYFLRNMPFFPNRAKHRFARSVKKRRNQLLSLIGRDPGTASYVFSSQDRRSLAPLFLKNYSGKAFKICVVLHIYYIDVAEEIIEMLKSVNFDFDLYITTKQEFVENLKEIIIRDFPHIRYHIIPSCNRGRNFGPMLVELTGFIRDYDLLLHLHTKKSLRTGSEQSDWRRHIFEHLLGSQALVNGILQAFRTHSDLGVVGPLTTPMTPYWWHSWLSVSHRIEDFFERLGIARFPRFGLIDFPVGGMFWARVAALSPLWNAVWSYDDFEPEPSAADGTLAHVIERSIGIIAGSTSHTYAETDLGTGEIWAGSAEKGLSRYFSEFNENLAVLGDFDSISFDFYDTLFTRLTVRPDDVLHYLGSVLENCGAGNQGADFFTLRKKAEATARRIKGDGDVGLREIYAAFSTGRGNSKEIAEQAERLEREIEAKVLVPRPEMIDFAFKLHRSGKRIFIVSDTYMDSEFMRFVLRSHGLDGVFSEIILSSELGRRKDTGEIWPWLREREQTAGRRYLHIGDNERSDMQKPLDHGVPSFGLLNTAVLADLRKCPMPPAWREGGGDWRDGILLGPLVAQVGSRVNHPIFGLSYKFTSAWEFGRAILGPIALAFMSWLARRASQDSVDHVYFLARGGYFLHDLYNKLHASGCDLPESSYLYVSRRAVLPAAFSITGDVGIVLQGAGGFKGTFGDLLNARLGLPPDAIPEHASKTVHLPEGRGLVEALMMEISDKLISHCQIGKDHLLSYLQQQGVVSAKMPGLVDLGYSATIQKALQIATKKGMVGYYMGTTSAAAEVRMTGGAVWNCFGEERLGAPPPSIIRYSLLLEALFGAPNGQVQGYGMKERSLQPLVSNVPESGVHFRALCEAADGMSSYCLDLVSAFGVSILRTEYEATSALRPLEALFSGWGGIPPELVPALVVDDAFCGFELHDVLHVLGYPRSEP